MGGGEREREEGEEGPGERGRFRGFGENRSRITKQLSGNYEKGKQPGTCNETKDGFA